MADTKNIALALSGGGIRAMVFHLGVLKYLSEQNKLEAITHISTVSGGSLIIGLLFKENQMQWPTSSQYNEFLLPSLREKLCTKSLLGGIIRQFLKPKNWYFLLSRANLLAFALRDEWGINHRLADLPVVPEWSINGTTAETGKRFRFKQKDFGDYSLGYASSKNFPLANALAVSAGFPGGIGPLVIQAAPYEWKKRGKWNDSIDNDSVVSPFYSKLHVYDGGVYDNLGLEPFFDAGKGILKDPLSPETKLILSDAGAPLSQGFSLSKVNPWRLKRITDIISDQSRALRIRTFMNYIQKDRNKGSLIYIAHKISGCETCSSAEFASKFATTIRRLTYEEFDKLFNHGYEIAKIRLSE
ncbi:patatin-like phospholipase family protein [Acinetobacter baumannii]